MEWTIDYRPETLPIFTYIQRYGEIDDREMYATFNMGVGFCVAVPPEEAGRAIEMAGGHGIAEWRIGYDVEQRGHRMGRPLLNG